MSCTKPRHEWRPNQRDDHPRLLCLLHAISSGAMAVPATASARPLFSSMYCAAILPMLRCSIAREGRCLQKGERSWNRMGKRTETNGKGSGLPAAVGSQSPPAASGRPGCLAARKCNNTCQSLKSLNRKSLNPQPHTLRFQMEAMLMPRGDGRGRAAERLSCRHWRCAPPALRWQQQHHNERR